MDEETQIYMEQLMDNYKNPQNTGKLKDYTYLQFQKNVSCGDQFTLYLKTNDKDIITDVKFDGEGCAISTASFSLLSQKLINMDLEDAKKLSENDIYDMIGIKISPNRINCAMLPLNAFTNSLKK